MQLRSMYVRNDLVTLIKDLINDGDDIGNHHQVYLQLARLSIEKQKSVHVFGVVETVGQRVADMLLFLNLSETQKMTC